MLRPFLWLLSALLLASCADEEAPPEPLVTGVNDVRAACEIQASWKNLNSSMCAACRAASVLPPCGCPYVDQFGARCSAQAESRRSHAECTAALDDCVSGCEGDCGCVDGCYASAAGCRAATSARDGCVVEICAEYCE